MEKKITASDKPLITKIVYGVVIGILCLTAIIVGIIAAADKPAEAPSDIPVEEPGNQDDTNVDEPIEDPESEVPTFVAPMIGTIMEDHDLTTPVFSETLGAWRVHAGVDISAEDGQDVRAAEDGVIKAVYNDQKLGYTVEVEHKGGFVTRYSNLKADSCPFKAGDAVKSGDVIGKIGDTATSEIAKEPHLHFEILKDGKKLNPLDHITEESKKEHLGIE